MFPWAGSKLAFAPRGVLVWQYSPGLYLPTDNVDAKNTYGVGLVGAANTLVGGGHTVYLPFTTVGSNPTIGQTVWMASAHDDSGTGRGKATATIPDTTVPPLITGFPYGCQNITPIGICTGVEDVPGSRYFRVFLAATPFGPVPNTVPPDTTQTFHGVQCVGSSYATPPYLQTLTTPQVNINDGETMVWTFTADDILQADPRPGALTGVQLVDDATGHYWELFSSTQPNNLSFDQFSGAFSGYMGSTQPGINKFAVTNTGGLFRVCLNGQSFPGLKTVDSSGTVSGPTGHLRIYWNIGAFTSMVKLARVLSDAELIAYTKLVNTFTGTYMSPGDNPWGPNAALVSDPAMQWYLDLTGYTSGPINSIGGPMGVGFIWTVVGVPTVQTWTIDWYHSPASLFQFGTPAVYDQKHATKTTPFAGIRFTATHMSEFANLVIGGLCEDEDDDDEVAGVLVATSGATPAIPIASYGWGNLGTQEYTSPVQLKAGAEDWWYTTGALNGGPYVCDLIVGAQVWRQDTFASGMSVVTIGIPSSITIDTPTTARLLIVSGDAETLGGQHQDFGNCAPWSAVLTQMRRDYPGKITADVMAEWDMNAIFQWGNGSMLPYAQWLFDRRTLGSPATHEYLLMTGFYDWNFARTTLAVAAARAQALINAIRALDPAAVIWSAKPSQVPLFGNLNSNGETLLSYVTAWAAFTSCTILDVTGPSTVAYTAGGAAVFGPTGQGNLAANFKVQMGY
jgi:hypothetical protein